MLLWNSEKKTTTKKVNYLGLHLKFLRSCISLNSALNFESVFLLIIENVRIYEDKDCPNYNRLLPEFATGDSSQAYVNTDRFLSLSWLWLKEIKEVDKIKLLFQSGMDIKQMLG